jgi:hypothetical protein
VPGSLTGRGNQQLKWFAAADNHAWNAQVMIAVRDEVCLEITKGKAILNKINGDN